MNQHDNDIKNLSRRALDILIPYLPTISLFGYKLKDFGIHLVGAP